MLEIPFAYQPCPRRSSNGTRSCCCMTFFMKAEMPIAKTNPRRWQGPSSDVPGFPGRYLPVGYHSVRVSLLPWKLESTKVSLILETPRFDQLPSKKSPPEPSFNAAATDLELLYIHPDTDSTPKAPERLSSLLLRVDVSPRKRRSLKRNP